MIDKIVIEYIKQNIQNGFSIDQIKKKLVQSGHSEHDVDHEIYIATRQRPPSMVEILTKEQTQNNNDNNNDSLVNPSIEENKNNENQLKNKNNDKDKLIEKKEDNSNKITNVKKKSHIGLIITLILIILLLGAPAGYFFAAQQGYVPYEPIQQVQDYVYQTYNNLINPTEQYSIDNLPPPDRHRIPPPENNPNLSDNKKNNDSEEIEDIKLDNINTTLNESLEINDLVNISDEISNINQSFNVNEEINTTSNNQTNITE